MDCSPASTPTGGASSQVRARIDPTKSTTAPTELGVGSENGRLTGSTHAVTILRASRCGDHLRVVSAAATHLHNLRGRRDMFGKKVFAAMLATVLGASLFGANVAKAVIVLDAETKPPVVTYATETLVPSNDSDLRGYSVVMGSGTALNVEGMVGLAGTSGTTVTIQFDLGGMVFSDTAPDITIVGSYGGVTRRAGGMKGQNFVSYIAPRSGTTMQADVVTLPLTQIGVKPGVGGSVTMTVTDSLGDGLMHMSSYPNAVRTMRALQETAMPLNLEATVEQRFQSFGTGDDNNKGTLGSFMVGVKTEYLNAADGAAVAQINIYDNDESSVTISGDFSFASMAWLDAMADCSGEPDDLLLREDEMVMDELKERMPSAFATDAVPPTAMYLCISVPEGDEAVAIPATDPYMVTTEYAEGTMGAGWPPNAGEHALGSITRDGTTVHIPYLTTWADYNQRIVVSNRSANEAPYWITFRPEEGVVATPGMYATGMLAGNSTMMLRAMDVVTLDGRTRTAATFVAEAQSSQIDVATVIVNMMTGSTDTVNYDTD